MLLADGYSCTIAIGTGKQVLADKSFDVARVARHLLVSYFMVRSINPIFRVTTHIAEDDLVLVNSRYEV